MAFEGNTRIPLACKFCRKLQDVLSVHLRRVCQKDAGEVAIKRLVEEARSNMRQLVRNLSIVQYEDLDHSTSSCSPQDFLARFLESKGSIVPVESHRYCRSRVTTKSGHEDPAVGDEDTGWEQPRNTRIPLVCKFCLKLNDNLSVHLRRVCRKDGVEAEFKELVEEARSKMRYLVRSFSVVVYEDLDCSSSSPRHFFVTFLEDRGIVVVNKPSGGAQHSEDVLSHPTRGNEEMETEEQPSSSKTGESRNASKAFSGFSGDASSHKSRRCPLLTRRSGVTPGDVVVGTVSPRCNEGLQVQARVFLRPAVFYSLHLPCIPAD